MKQNLIDRAEFVVRGGRGGNGSIHFRREKYVPKGGPDGGSGGLGGCVVFEADAHVATLRAYAGKDRFEALDGRPGGKRGSSGENAEDVVFKVPVGTVIMVKNDEYRLREGLSLYGEKDYTELIVEEERSKSDRTDGFAKRWGLSSGDDSLTNSNQIDSETTLAMEAMAKRQGDTVDVSRISDVPSSGDDWVEVADLSEAGKRVVVAYGGHGGRGNMYFKSSSMTTPKFAERGENGEKFVVRLELKLLADAGLIGLPNAGKSTLLSVLSAARPEIADYPFTTLSPNLGVMQGLRSQSRDRVGVSRDQGRDVVIADIPGLIEGASQGKGLGHEFLRHVERCRVLVHVIAPRISNFQFPIANDDVEGVFEEMWEDYETIRKELGEYALELESKPELVVVNKLDLIQEAELKIKELFEEKGKEVVMVSAATTDGVEELKERLMEFFKN